MKKVNFIVDTKPEMINVKWSKDEGNSDWWYEDTMEDGENLQKGDSICIDDLIYLVNKKVYHLHEGEWSYYLEPVFRYNNKSQAVREK